MRKFIFLFVILFSMLFALALFGSFFQFGFSMIVRKVPDSVSVGMFLLGLLLYFLGKLYLRKKYVYHHDSNDTIRLSTPVIADYLYILGVMCMIIGMIFSKFINDLGLNGFRAKLVLGVFYFFVVYKLIQMLNRLRFALHDKIIVSNNNIKIDDTKGKSTEIINMNDINQILYFKKFEKNRAGHYSSSNYSFSLCLALKAKGQEAPRKVELEPENMNIKLEYLVDALKEMNYELTLVSKKDNGEEWIGHDFQ